MNKARVAKWAIVIIIALFLIAVNVTEVVESSEATIEIVQNRKGKVLIEKCIGIVVDAENGDGIIINTNSDYNYINYSRVTGFQIENGTKICTYLIYNPTNNYIDDIILRFDFLRGD